MTIEFVLFATGVLCGVSGTLIMGLLLSDYEDEKKERRRREESQRLSDDLFNRVYIETLHAIVAAGSKETKKR